MAGNFRNGAYDALVEALKARREETGLSQMAVAAAMPPSQIIRHDQHNIRRPRLGLNRTNHVYKNHTEAQRRRDVFNTPLWGSVTLCET